MVKLEDYFNDESVKITQSLNNETYNEWLQGYSEHNLWNMVTLGKYMILNHDEPETIRAGVGWLLKVLDMYENNMCSPGFNALLTNDYLYNWTKNFLASVFMPSMPLIRRLLLEEKIEKNIPSDAEFAIKMLKDFVNTEHATADAYITLSIAYYHGTGVERDNKKAREYFEKAVQSDNEHDTMDAEFVEYYSKLLDEQQ